MNPTHSNGIQIWGGALPGPDREALSVLCVEDESATRLMLGRLLEKHFAKVLVAEDGQKGLELFLRERPPIVVTDLVMPVMDGIAMARVIKREAPATHIIVITSHAESAMILSAVDVGVIDYVLKPVDAVRLPAAIDKCFHLDNLERAVRLSKARTESILESIGDAFFALDRNWRFTYLNERAEALFQSSRASLLGTSIRDLPGDLVSVHPGFQEAMEAQQDRVFDVLVPGPERWHDVSIFPLAGGITVYLRDITEKLKADQEIQFLAFHDRLTGLPNRTNIQERLRHAILRCKRTAQQGAVLFLDLDRFKAINDSLGHEAGDLVLKEVAARLLTALRDCDTVARLGGDEFIILLEGFVHPDNIHSITHRLLLSLTQDMVLNGITVAISGSIGISFIPEDGETVEELLKASDTAMYHVKAHGRNTYHFYQPEMNVEKLQYLQLESALRKSVKNRDFRLHYQPQFELSSHTLLGFEALVRWEHPDLGLVQPEAFIPLAEDTGLILLLGDWVVETACQQAQAWGGAQPGGLRMAVNLSGRQFWQGDLVEAIARALDQAGLPPERLELEITESLVMRDVDLAIAKMRQLTAMGIRLSMDDFGTGYSSLAALKRFPIHTLKIDKSFVKEVTTSPNDAAICASVIALAHSLNLTVVAEGIETPEQLAFLKDKGCEIGQGYLFSRPLPAEQAWKMLMRSFKAC